MLFCYSSFTHTVPYVVLLQLVYTYGTLCCSVTAHLHIQYPVLFCCSLFTHTVLNVVLLQLVYTYSTLCYCVTARLHIQYSMLFCYSSFTHTVPYVVQANKQENESRDTLWSAGVCSRWRQNLYSILGEILFNAFAHRYTFIARANSLDPDQSAHPFRLIRI
jgi:hypothetical protein